MPDAISTRQWPASHHHPPQARPSTRALLACGAMLVQLRLMLAGAPPAKSSSSDARPVLGGAR